MPIEAILRAMVKQNSRKLSKINDAGSPSVAPKYPRRPTHRPTDHIPSRYVFTKKLIDGLPIPKGQRTYYYDSSQRGLVLSVHPTGRKTFSLYRKIDGRPRRINIGPYPDLTIEQARKEAQRLAGEIARGQNPAEKQRAIRDEMTFEELFAVYLEKHAKVHKRTWKQDADEFRLHLDGLRRKISSITRPQLGRPTRGDRRAR